MINSIISTFFIAGFLWFINPSYSQTIHYVKEGGTGTGNSWENASGDLQEMINISSANDQIWVAHGTYYPNRLANDIESITPNNRFNSFVLKSDVKIYGGFPNNNTGTIANRNWSEYPTVLSGNMDSDNMNNAFHVVISAGDVGSAELNGFMVTDGDGSAQGDDITVNSQIIYSFRGGGLYIANSAPIIINCTFSGNKADNGAAIYNQSRYSPTVTNSFFLGNQARFSGSVIYSSYYSSIILTNCVITGNQVVNGNGLIYGDHSSFVINNCTIAGNHGGNMIYIDDAISCKIYNSIILGNGSNIYPFDNFDVRNSLIQGLNNSSFGNIPSSGIISTDIFLNPQLPGLSISGDYSLNNSSSNPAVNAGSDALYLSASQQGNDVLGDSRSSNCKIDLGAYELQQNYITPWHPITNSPIIYHLNDVTSPLTATYSNSLYNIHWYSDSTGETLLDFPPTPDSSIPGITKYFVSQFDSTNNCEGPIMPIDVFIIGGPATGLDFDGVDDYVEIISPQNFPEGNSSYTIEAWIKPKSFANNFILGWGDYSTEKGSSILYFDSQNSLAHSNWSLHMYKEYLFLPNQWYHIAATYNNNTNIKTIYVNGTSIGTQYIGDQNYLELIPNKLILGGLNNSYYNKFHGEMDDVRIWNIVRTQFEIENFKDCPLQGNEDGLMAYYQFNSGFAHTENTGLTLLTDITLNENNATLYNFDLDGIYSNWVYGKLGETLPSSSLQTNVSCNGDEDGSAMILVNGDSSIYSYFWTPNGNTSNTSINLSAGTYTVNILGEETCAMIKIVITEPDPVDVPVLDTQFFCDSVRVENLPSIGDSIQWYNQYNGNPLSPSTPLLTGNYFFSQTTGGCESERIPISIIITLIDSSISVNGIILIANYSGATYQWIDCNNGNNPISGANSQSFTPSENGIYAVIVTVNGCTETSNCIVVNSVGIESLEQNEWTISPNPNNGLFTISTSQNVNETEIEVYSTMGKLVYKNIHSGNDILLDIHQESNGVYILKVNQQNFRVVKF